MNRKDKRKLDAVIEYLTEEHLYGYGGYPNDFAIVGDEVFVAEAVPEAGTHLGRYQIIDLLAAYDQAKQQEPGDWTCVFRDCLESIRT